MLRAFKLYTGADGASHVLEGTIDETDRTDVIATHFKETPRRILRMKIKLIIAA